MSRRALVAVVACASAALALAAGCSDDPVEPAEFVCTPLATECTGEAPGYAAVVAPIILNNCSQCHNSEDHLAWPLDDPTDVADWSDSVLLNLGGCAMPPRDSDVVMSDADREALNAWLLCGAPNN
jgi:hypothetical protein